MRKLQKFITCLALSSSISYSAVVGNAFKDYNADGIKQDGEPSVSGVVVKAYDANNSLVAKTTTASDGNYSLDIANYPVRLEFELPTNCMVKANQDFPSAGSVNYGSDIQFATTDNETHNFALSYPYDFSIDENPEVYTTTLINGDPLAGGTTADSVSIVKFHFKDSKIAVNGGRKLADESNAFNRTADETGPAWIEVAKQYQTGSIYGLAYSRAANKLFASALLKRHTGFGPLGAGGIYIISPDKNASEQENIEFLNLDAIGIATSDTTKEYKAVVINGDDDDDSNDIVEFSPTIGSNAQRGLLGNIDSPSNDPLAYVQVGKLGLGDIDISEDGRYLYVVNLYDRKLYKIDLTDAKNPIAPTLENRDEKVESFEIPNICTYSANAGEYRPFGLKVAKGKAYVGIVCSGQDEKGYVVADSTADMKGAVYSLDINNNSWQSEVEWSFDYRDNDGSQNPWHIWINSWINNKKYSMPIISDIEFDNSGNLLIGIKDLYTDMLGSLNYGLTGTHKYDSVSAGDLIKATKEIESAECSYEMDLDREFYHDGLIHPESTGGALAGHHTSYTDSVLSTFEDPILTTATKVFGYGVHLYNNKTGRRVYEKIGYEIVYRRLNHMSKANAIGDLETMEVTPSIEVGNRVWLDSNKNGIQDASEHGIAGVKLLLSQGDDCSNVIATTKTNSRGEYFFNHTNVNANSQNPGLMANSDYTICIDKAQFINGKGLDYTPLANMILTKKEAASSLDNAEKIDSNGELNNALAVVSVHTKNAGENDHSYDFGFIKSYCIKARVWEDNNTDGILNNQESNFTKEVTIELLDANGNSVNDIYNNEVSAISTTDGSYEFCNLEEGKYKVRFTIADNYTFTAKNTTGNSLTDSDVNKDSNETDTFLLRGSDYSVNAGVIKLASLGDFIWYDKNENGIQDKDEKGIAGVKVYLYKDGKFSQRIAVSKDDGSYIFNNLEPATYSIKIELPNGYKTFTKASKTNDAKDSDITAIKIEDNKTYGFSKEVKLSSAQDYKDLDAGVIYKFAPAIDIEKFTKDSSGKLFDADSTNSEMPEFIIGQSVTWIYRVKNIGNVELANVKVLDNKEGAINCPKASLKVGEEMECSKSGVAEVKLYENNASVSATFNNALVTDSDLSHYKALKPVCIGDFIWEDSNKNGIFDNNESAIEGAKLKLYFKDGAKAVDINGNEIKELITDSSGKYKFCNLDPTKEYYVTLSAIKGYELTAKNSGKNSLIDSDFNANYKSDTISFAKDRDNFDIDGGLYKSTHCLGNLVWDDKNRNGIQDKNEARLAGIKVILNQDPTKTAITNSKGEYKICGLENGEYSVTLDKSTLPKDYVVTQKNSAKDNIDSDIETDGKSDSVLIKDSDNLTLDMGVFKVKSAILVRKFTNNKDAKSKESAYIAKPYESITWKYVVVNIGSEPLVDVVVIDDKEGKISCPKSALDINESMVCKKSAKATKLEYENKALVTAKGKLTQKDVNSSDLSHYKLSTKPAIKIEKYTNNKDADNTKGPLVDIGSVVKWKYVVTNIGNEKLIDVKVIDDKEVNIICPKDTLDVNETMECNKANLATAGEYENNGTALAVGAISKLAVKDSDLSHYFGVDAKIDIEKFTNNLQADNNTSDMPTIIEGETVTWKYVVANRGNVALSDIKVVDNKEGTIKCPKESLDINESMECFKEGIAKVDANKNSSIYANIATVSAKTPTNKEVNDTDASHYHAIKTACLGNKVWEDTNANGIYEQGELAVSNVKIELYSANGKLVATNTTDKNGEYKFCNLTPNNYYIKVLPTAGYYVSPKNATSNKSKDSDIDPKSYKSDTITLKSGEEHLDLDIGLFKSACLGNKIWLDSNADGIQDKNEVGVANIEVKLYQNGKEVTKNLAGKSFEQKTDKNGIYNFCELMPGEYEVRVSVPNGYYVTRKDTTNDNRDSDMGEFLDTNKVVSMPKVTLTSAQNNQTLDGGLFKSACLGDYVWLDTNVNGIQDKDEQPLEDISVKLIPLKDSNGYINQTDVDGNIIKDKVIKTDKNGHYEYCNLIPGVYKVAFKSQEKEYLSTKNQEIDKDKNSDINEFKNVSREWLETNDVNLTSNSSLKEETLDAGLTKNICLGDRVWLDDNANGIQDKDEQGVVGIVVKLYTKDDKEVIDLFGNVVKAIKTNSNGNYKFCNLKPSQDYKIKFELPSTYNATVQNVGSDNKDSDANKNLEIYVKSPTNSDMTLDLGIFCDCADTKADSKTHKELKASFNIFSSLFAIFILVFLSIRKKQK